MLLASSALPLYRCPGEEYSIPHAVHVARMAANYPGCATCLYRNGPRDDLPLNDSAPVVSASPLAGSLVASEGLRGKYLNALDRHQASRAGAAFAACLWNDWATSALDERRRPAIAIAQQTAAPAESVSVISDGVLKKVSGTLRTREPPPEPASSQSSRHLFQPEGRLHVVLAHDERPFSPDLAVGVAAGLRQMGCHVVDLGLSTRPEFWFAVRHLGAAGGVQITGTGCDPSWTGLDFVRRDAQPCSRGTGLDRIARAFIDGATRPSRRTGGQQLLPLRPVYEARFKNYFHALRPLRFALACPNRLLREQIGRLVERLPARPHLVETPVRARNLLADDDPDVARVAATVPAISAHFGLLIDDDAQACVVFDESGRRVDPLRLLEMFAVCESAARPQGPAGHVVFEGRPVLSPPLQGGALRGRTAPGSAFEGRQIPIADATLEGMWQAMQSPGALCGAGQSGRFWFIEEHAVCDALLTLFKLLQLLSQSDAALSEALA
ncbi:MAG: hypothetical protein ACT4QC_09600 [Planctomycetaceae bacterium]